MTQVLSEQEIFNQVADHLLTQKKKSRDPKVKSCQYRGPNGLKCAVGGILEDHEVQFGGNNCTVYSIDLPDRLQGHVKFLRELQSIHDKNRPSRWLEKLSAFAKKHKLSASVLKKYRKPKSVKVTVEEAPLTKQAIFDKVATHLLTQKKKSRDPKIKTCLYRGPNGLKCAVGCLLRDDEITMKENDYTVWSLKLPNTLLGQEYFLRELQIIHDTNKPSKWINKLSLLATKECLNKDVLKQFRKVTK